MASKYQPLTEHLAALAEADRQSVNLPFADVGALVGGLPQSAYHTRQWWANNSLTQAVAWRAAGWHVDHVDFEHQRIRFARGKVGGSRTTSSQAPKPNPPSADAFPVELANPNVDLRVRMTWNRAGPVISEQGRLVFPALPKAAGIYRLTFSGNGHRFDLGWQALRCAGCGLVQQGLWIRPARRAGGDRWARGARDRSTTTMPRTSLVNLTNSTRAGGSTRSGTRWPR